MEVKAQLKYLRIAPRKVRQVADLIRGKTAKDAEALLGFAIKRGAKDLLGLLESAEASAKNNLELNKENLYIKKILVQEGPKYKRWMPRARGQSYQIQKKTSHVTIVLDERIEKGRGKTEKPKKTEEKIEAIRKELRVPQAEKPKFKPEIETPKPKVEKSFKRFFRRKAI